nr:hypothetical protein [Chloroflexota bacterium]
MSADEQSQESARLEEQALQDLLQFPFVDALFGRRSRRFFRGAEVPDGPLAYTSRHAPLPLTELERMLILTAVGGTTGWHHSITRHERYAPHVSNYPGAAGGRTFPSAAGFHTSEIFFTDDSGTYIMETRDAPAQVPRAGDGSISVEELLKAQRGRIRKLSEQRVYI